MNYSRPETKFRDYAALPKGHDALGFDEMKRLVREFIDGCKHTTLWECSEAEESDEKEKLQELTL
jgi:hypothetical protein